MELVQPPFPKHLRDPPSVIPRTPPERRLVYQKNPGLSRTNSECPPRGQFLVLATRIQTLRSLPSLGAETPSTGAGRSSRRHRINLTGRTTSPGYVEGVIAARYQGGSDPVEAVVLCEAAACTASISAHLLEDRRHIQDRDIWRLRETHRDSAQIESHVYRNTTNSLRIHVVSTRNRTVFHLVGIGK